MRHLRWALLAVLVTSAVALVPSGPAAAGASSCPPAGGDGRARVAVVVDFGTLPGAPSGPSVVCVSVRDGANGYAALVARTTLLHSVAPRLDANGAFLCGVDGYPAETCAVSGGNPNQYWSYWRGGCGDWTYASMGSMSTALHDGAIEGWRFVDTASTERTNAPRYRDTAALFPERCGGAAATTAPAPTAAPKAPPTTAAGGPRPTAARPGSRQVSPATTAPTTTVAESSASTPSTAPATTPATAAASPTVAGTSVERDPSTAATQAPSTSTTDGVVLHATNAAAGQAGAAEPRPDDDDDTTASATVAAIVIVALAGSFAVVQARRKRLRR